MESLTKLFQIGNGPSSSHTMGPQRAARIFAEQYPAPDSYRVTLYGSLAATGKGHLTDRAILGVLEPIAPVELLWEPTVFLEFHPNGMKFEALKNGETVGSRIIYSVGGGALSDGVNAPEPKHIYPLRTIAEIENLFEKEGITYWEYVERCEGKEIWDFLGEVWDAMRNAVERGLRNEGVLPGGLGLQRKAGTYHVKAKGYNGAMQSREAIFLRACGI